MSDELTIGVDIGGTKMAFVVADRQGKVYDECTLPTDSGGAARDTLDRISQQLNTLIARYERVSGIGVGVPGPIDVERGVVLNAVNLGWENVAVRAEICANLARPLPIFVDNDVNVGAIGEQLFGSAIGIADYVYITVGTGVGGAVMLNNRLLRGASNSEMEIGHVSLDPVHGRECGCGLRGCLEMSVSGKGIVAHARQHCSDYPNSALSHDSITTHEIIRTAAAGDALATHVMNEAAMALGIAIAWCVNLFNPTRIVLGGGLIQASWRLLEHATLDAARTRCLADNYESVTISLSQLTNGALGASALVRYHRDLARAKPKSR